MITNNSPYIIIGVPVAGTVLEQVYATSSIATAPRYLERSEMAVLYAVEDLYCSKEKTI